MRIETGTKPKRAKRAKGERYLAPMQQSLHAPFTTISAFSRLGGYWPGTTPIVCKNTSKFTAPHGATVWESAKTTDATHSSRNGFSGNSAVRPSMHSLRNHLLVGIKQAYPIYEKAQRRRSCHCCGT